MNTDFGSRTGILEHLVLIDWFDGSLYMQLALTEKI